MLEVDVDDSGTVDFFEFLCVARLIAQGKGTNFETSENYHFIFYFSTLVNPLSPGVKLQILLLCFHTFLTEVVGRSCSDINTIELE